MSSTEFRAASAYSVVTVVWNGGVPLLLWRPMTRAGRLARTGSPRVDRAWRLVRAIVLT
jgi:hypothetical protein